jgi:ribosomal-protein-alanine N-acetyltransferase
MEKSSPPVKFEYASVEHVQQMYDIEKQSFTTPWSPESLLKDVADNRLATYIVAKADGKVVAYAGFWLIFDEAHIMNIAVRKEYRAKGIGKAILDELLKKARRQGAASVGLEVRENNAVAIRMYENAGFVKNGIRKGYYTDTGENALLMVKIMEGPDSVG